MLRSDRLSQDDGLHPVRRLSPEGLEALWQPIQHDSSSPHLPVSHFHSRWACGLRPATSWLLCIIAVLIIGGAIGGGVAGVLLANKKKFSGSSRYVNSSLPMLSADLTIQSTCPNLAATTTSTSPSVSSSSPSTIPLSTLSSTTLSAPVAAGTTGVPQNPCPEANQTTYTSSTGSLFTLFCSVDWHRGILFQTDLELFWTWDILCSILLAAALNLVCPTTKIPEAIRIHAKLSLTNRI